MQRSAYLAAAQITIAVVRRNGNEGEKFARHGGSAPSNIALVRVHHLNG